MKRRHKLRATLDDLAAVCGPDRPVTLCRELTKLHEEIFKTTLGEAAARYAGEEPRGEFVLVLAGAPEGDGEAEAPPTLAEAAAAAAPPDGRRAAARRRRAPGRRRHPLQQGGCVPGADPRTGGRPQKVRRGRAAAPKEAKR